MKKAKKMLRFLRSFGVILFAALICSAAAADRANLYLGDKLVYSCREFRSEQNTLFLPLQPSAHALGIEGFADPQSRMVFFRHQSTLVMIDTRKKEVTVNDTVTPLSRAPLWTEDQVFIPQQIFTEVLSGVMGAEIRIIRQPENYPDPKNPGPGRDTPRVLANGQTGADPNAAGKNSGNGLSASALRNPVDVIVIDPGHGGEDTGAKGPEAILEKEVTLELAKKLKRLLEEKGLIVHLTREEDVYMSLADRSQKARRLSADVFISIHANGYKLISAQGFETFFASLTATDQAALDLAEWENQAGVGESSPSDEVKTDLEMILGNMAQTESLAESQRLAEMFQKDLARVMDSDNRGVKQAPFKVLMEATMPAVLVEVGFITSPKEARMITDPEMQERIVNALASAITDYRDQTNARLGLAPGP